jgi:hypothetical protein
VNRLDGLLADGAQDNDSVGQPAVAPARGAGAWRETWARHWRLLSLSALIQIVVAPFTSLPGDVAVWLEVVQRTMAGDQLYQLTGFSYPPLYGYWCMFLGGLAKMLGIPATAFGGADWKLVPNGGYSGPLFVSTPFATLLLKLPMIAAGVLGVWFIIRIVERLRPRSPRAARIAGTLFGLSPLLIIESGVHGQIDAIAACSLAAALWYAIEGRSFATGVSLAVGVAAKLTPVFAAGPLLAWFVARGRTDRPWEEAGRFMLGAGAGAAALIGPVLGPGFLRDVFTRISTGQGIGGLNLTGFLLLPALASAKSVILRHQAVWVQISPFLMLSLSFVFGWRVLQSPSPVRLVRMVTMSMLVVLAISPVVSPQYLLWVLPGLTILGACASTRRARWSLFASWLGLGVAALLYLVALFGLGELLAPMSRAFGVPSPGFIEGEWRWLASGKAFSLLPAADGSKLTLLASLIAVVAAILLVIGAIWVGNGPAPELLEASPSRWTGWPSGLLGLSCCLEAFALCAPLLGGAVMPSASVQLVGAHEAVLRLSRVPEEPIAVFLTKGSPIEDIDVYEPGPYPTSGSSSAAVLGTFQALSNQGLGVTIRGVDAAGLLAAMENGTKALHTLVVDVAGTLPTTVWGTKRFEPLRSFLSHGGTLAFAGNIPGVYQVKPGPVTVEQKGHQVLAPGDQLLPDDALLPAGLIVGSDRWGIDPSSRPSRLAEGLGLRYANLEVPVSAQAVEKLGGVDFGFKGPDGTTSEAQIPLDGGQLLVFAGVTTPASITNDLGTLLRSGWFGRTGPVEVVTPKGHDALVRIERFGAATVASVVIRSANPQSSPTILHVSLARRS